MNIVATPGRLNDLVEKKVIDVCTITFLILDEGKEKTIKTISTFLLLRCFFRLN